MEPWLSIIGIAEDGLDGLTEASRKVLDRAEVVFGGARHLELARVGARGCAWAVPFSIEPVLANRGRNVAVLASGDPFWFGVGGSLAEKLSPEEWVAFPGPSTFSLLAARLGWRIEDCVCLGLHAAPFEHLVPYLARGARVLCLVRDGAAAGDLGRWLESRGFGQSPAWLFEAVGGPREQRYETTASGLKDLSAGSLIAVAVQLEGGSGTIRSSGLPDDAFQHDGQITKRPVRALTLSALAPRAGERLWDIGAGSGSISIEWLLATGKSGRAIAIEPRSERAANVRANAIAFGVADRLQVIDGEAPDALHELPIPNAVFVGGGASDTLLRAIWSLCPTGTRVVVNAVTLETEALLLDWSERFGGELLRIDLAQAAPLGNLRGWLPSRPLVQWRGVI